MDVGGLTSDTYILSGQCQKVCKQFEAYFLEQVFKEMQKTVDAVKDENSLDTSNSMIDYFQDMTIQSLASTSTELQGLGLAQTLYEQMKRNYGIE